MIIKTKKHTYVLKKSVNEKITVFYAPDNKYSKLALVSMTSILENTKNDIEIVILYSDLNEKSLKMFDCLKNYSNCTLNKIKLDDDEFKNFPLARWVTVQAWYRIKIPDLRPDLNKAVYLDCDTLLNGNIKELWNIDMSKYSLAGVGDIYSQEKHVKRLKMESKYYFNSGMLYINCKKWRENNIFEKIKEYALNNKEELEASDQDIINKIIDKDKLPLHQKFNYMEVWWKNFYNEYKGLDLITYKQAKENPLIIHYTGRKPYQYETYHTMKSLWWKYAKKTPVYIELLEEYKKDADSVFENKLNKK